MAYRWKPGRDAGCVSSHRNPNTRRRYTGEQIPNMLTRSYRAQVKVQLRTVMPLLLTGEYGVSIAPQRRGWDDCDPMLGMQIVVISEVKPDPEPEYEPIPDWMWDLAYERSDWFDPDPLNIF